MEGSVEDVCEICGIAGRAIPCARYVWCRGARCPLCIPSTHCVFEKLVDIKNVYTISFTCEACCENELAIRKGAKKPKREISLTKTANTPVHKTSEASPSAKRKAVLEDEESGEDVPLLARLPAKKAKTEGRSPKISGQAAGKPQASQHAGGSSSKPSAAVPGGTINRLPSASSKQINPAAHKGTVDQSAKLAAGSKLGAAGLAAVKECGPSLAVKRPASSNATKPSGPVAVHKVAAAAKPPAANSTVVRPQLHRRSPEDEFTLQLDPAPLDDSDSGGKEMVEVQQRFLWERLSDLEDNDMEVDLADEGDELQWESRAAPKAAAATAGRAAAAAQGGPGGDKGSLATVQERKQALASLAGRNQQRNDVQNQQRSERAARMSADGGLPAAAAAGSGINTKKQQQQLEPKPAKAAPVDVGMLKPPGGNLKSGLGEKAVGGKLEAQQPQQQQEEKQKRPREDSEDEGKANVVPADPGMRSRAEYRLKKVVGKANASNHGTAGCLPAAAKPSRVPAGQKEPAAPVAPTTASPAAAAAPLVRLPSLPPPAAPAAKAVKGSPPVVPPKPAGDAQGSPASVTAASEPFRITAIMEAMQREMPQKEAAPETVAGSRHTNGVATGETGEQGTAGAAAQAQGPLPWRGNVRVTMEGRPRMSLKVLLRGRGVGEHLSGKVQALLDQQDLSGYVVSGRQLRLDADPGMEPFYGPCSALLYELPSPHTTVPLEHLIGAMVEKQVYVRFEQGVAEACFGVVSKDSKEVLDMDKLAREHRGPAKELVTVIASMVATDCLGLVEYVDKEMVANETATRQKWQLEAMPSLIAMKQPTKGQGKQKSQFMASEAQHAFMEGQQGQARFEAEDEDDDFLKGAVDTFDVGMASPLQHGAVLEVGALGAEDPGGGAAEFMMGSIGLAPSGWDEDGEEELGLGLLVGGDGHLALDSHDELLEDDVDMGVGEGSIAGCTDSAFAAGETDDALLNATIGDLASRLSPGRLLQTPESPCIGGQGAALGEAILQAGEGGASSKWGAGRGETKSGGQLEDHLQQQQQQEEVLPATHEQHWHQAHEQQQQPQHHEKQLQCVQTQQLQQQQRQQQEQHQQQHQQPHQQQHQQQQQTQHQQQQQTRHQQQPPQQQQQQTQHHQQQQQQQPQRLQHQQQHQQHQQQQQQQQPQRLQKQQPPHQQQQRQHHQKQQLGDHEQQQQEQPPALIPPPLPPRQQVQEQPSPSPPPPQQQEQTSPPPPQQQEQPSTSLPPPQQQQQAQRKPLSRREQQEQHRQRLQREQLQRQQLLQQRQRPQNHQSVPVSASPFVGVPHPSGMPATTALPAARSVPVSGSPFVAGPHPSGMPASTALPAARAQAVPLAPGISGNGNLSGALDSVPSLRRHGSLTSDQNSLAVVLQRSPSNKALMPSLAGLANHISTHQFRGLSILPFGFKREQLKQLQTLLSWARGTMGAEVLDGAAAAAALASGGRDHKVDILLLEGSVLTGGLEVLERAAEAKLPIKDFLVKGTHVVVEPGLGSPVAQALHHGVQGFLAACQQSAGGIGLKTLGSCSLFAFGVALIIDDRFLRHSTSLGYLAKLLSRARSKHGDAGTWGVFIRPASVEGDRLEARRWAEVKHGPFGSLLHVLGDAVISRNPKPDPPPIVKDAAKVAHNWRVETRYVVVVVPDLPPGSRSPEEKDEQLVLRAASNQRTLLAGTCSQVVQFLKLLDF